MQKVQTSDYQDRVFLPFKIPILKPDISETKLTEY